MSSLGRGDEHFHYSDGSHRWIAPAHLEQGVWEAGMRAHLGRHLITMGGKEEVDSIDLPRAYVPRQRREAVDPSLVSARRPTTPDVRSPSA